MALTAFPNLRLYQAWPITRSIGFDTVRHESMSGVRANYPNRSVPRWTWTVSFSVVLAWAYPDQYASGLVQLQQFFLSTLGGAYPFSFFDEEMGTYSGAIGTGDGATTAFQLLGAVGNAPAEPVILPLSVAVFVNGAVSAPSTYAVGNYGVVTFNSAPAAGAAITCAGRRQWLCRLDKDDADFVNTMKSIHELKEFSFSNEIVPT